MWLDQSIASSSCFSAETSGASTSSSLASACHRTVFATEATTCNASQHVVVRHVETKTRNRHGLQPVATQRNPVQHGHESTEMNAG